MKRSIPNLDFKESKGGGLGGRNKENQSLKFQNQEMLDEHFLRTKNSQRVIVEIIFSILDFLLKFVSPKNTNHPTFSRFNTKEKIRKCNLECIRNSQIIRSLVKFLGEYGIHFREFAMLVFDVMRELAKDEKLARKLCNENALSVVIKFLAKNSLHLRNYEVHLGFEVIWNTLSRVGRKAMRGLLNKEYIRHIILLFTNILVRTCKLEDKCLRNELMILFCYILDNSQSQDFLFDSIDGLSGNMRHHRLLIQSSPQSGPELDPVGPALETPGKARLRNMRSKIKFETRVSTDSQEEAELLSEWRTFDNFLEGAPSMVEILFYLVTCDENPERKQDYFDTSNEDLQFKLLVYYGISLLIKNNPQSGRIRLYLDKTCFVDRILFHVNEAASKKFSEPQKREIETEILRLLARTIETLFEDFMKFEGVTVLLKYMVFSKDPQKKILCLQIFLALLQIKDHSMVHNLDGTLVDHVIDNVSGEIDLHSLEDIGRFSLITELQTLSFNILSKLCSRSVHNQSRFQEKKGITILLSLLRNPIVLRSERMALFTLSLLDCLWHSVLNCNKNEAFFLENEGFYVILDFVDYCHSMHRKLALSILAVLIGICY